MTAVFLENLTWVEAEKHLASGAAVVIPLGAALKEHGRHLPLNNDKLMAQQLSSAIAKRLDIIVLPVIETSFYPAFSEYPGSISLSFETATALITETCTGLAKFGCSKIYVLNTGVSTARVLYRVKEELASQHPQLKFAYTDFKKALDSLPADLCQQPGGGHADEVETSIMLYLAPQVVAMQKAEADYHGDKPGPLTRSADRARDTDAVYSQSGAWGDPRLATREKGEIIVKRLLEWIEKDIRALI